MYQDDYSDMPSLEKDEDISTHYLASSLNFTSDMLKIDLIPGAKNLKREIYPGENVSDSIFFGIRYARPDEVNTSFNYQDVRQKKDFTYLLMLSCEYNLRPSDKFDQAKFSKYVHEFDKYREVNSENMNFRYLYDGFSVPVYKFKVISNIDTYLRLPYLIRILFTQEGMETLLYAFIYTLVFGYNYISLSDIIDYSIPSLQLDFYGFTNIFFEKVKNNVEAIKNNFGFLKDYLDNLKTEISLYSYIKKNVEQYYIDSLLVQKRYKENPYLNKKYYIFNNKNAIIYLLGDIEGDYLMILNWFIDNRFIDKTLAWIAPRDVYVIQCGDQLDKNNPAIENSIGFFRRERGQSVRKPDVNVVILFDYLYYISKGQVLSVIGNHDFASIQKQYRYVSNQDLVYRQTYNLFDKNNFLYNVILSRPFIILFNNLTISHAGLTDTIIDNYIRITKSETEKRLNQNDADETESDDELGVRKKIKYEFNLATFVNEINHFNFDNKDLTDLEFLTQPIPSNSIYRYNMFTEVIYPLMWTRDYKENLCHQVKKLKLNKLSDEEVFTINVIGHNPYNDVNYCDRTNNRTYIGGTHDLDKISTIKVDTGLSSRNCKVSENEDEKDVTEIKYAVIDSTKGEVQTKTYFYDCDAKNKSQFKFDVNFIEMFLATKDNLDLF